jgi:hypothetical protein
MERTHLGEDGGEEPPEHGLEDSLLIRGLEHAITLELPEDFEAKIKSFFEAHGGKISLGAIRKEFFRGVRINGPQFSELLAVLSAMAFMKYVPEKRWFVRADVPVHAPDYIDRQYSHPDTVPSQDTHLEELIHKGLYGEDAPFSEGSQARGTSGRSRRRRR